MTRTRILLATALVAIGAMTMTACSSGDETAAEVDAGAPRLAATGAVQDCGGTIDGRYETAQVKVVNQTGERLLLEPYEIDCYDWASTANPSRFNTDLAPGTASANELLAYRAIPELGGQIRPWNFRVSVYDPDEGFIIEGTPESRPTFEFAKNSCYTANGGMTACLGATLCTADSEEGQVSTKVPMRNLLTGETSELTMTTYCSVSDRASRIVFTR